MRFLLDTNVISDFMKAHPAVFSQFQAHTPDELAISTVTVQEITYGFAKQPAAQQKLEPVWHDLLSKIHVLEFDTRDAEQTAALRHDLKKRGTLIGPYDLQIAGTALARGLTLVTNNTSEFSRVAFLRLADWRGPE